MDDNGLRIHLSVANQHGYSKAKQPQPENIDRTEVQLCAKCHSRRAQLDDEFVPGDNFRDHYLPSLLAEPLYYADGKIKDEVYVYGSFQQSRMYQAGVTCSNCHNPHTLKLKSEGDTVCHQCHLAKDYATAKHHFTPRIVKAQTVLLVICRQKPIWVLMNVMIIVFAFLALI